MGRVGQERGADGEISCRVSWSRKRPTSTSISMSTSTQHTALAAEQQQQSSSTSTHQCASTRASISNNMTGGRGADQPEEGANPHVKLRVVPRTEVLAGHVLEQPHLSATDTPARIPVSCLCCRAGSVFLLLRVCSCAACVPIVCVLFVCHVCRSSGTRVLAAAGPGAAGCGKDGSAPMLRSSTRSAARRRRPKGSENAVNGQEGQHRRRWEVKERQGRTAEKLCSRAIPRTSDSEGFFPDHSSYKNCPHPPAAVSKNSAPVRRGGVLLLCEGVVVGGDAYLPSAAAVAGQQPDRHPVVHLMGTRLVVPVLRVVPPPHDHYNGRCTSHLPDHRASLPSELRGSAAGCAGSETVGTYMSGQ